MTRSLATLLAIAALAGSGCAWVFQEHLPSNYSGKYQPRCSTSKGLAALDGVFAVLNGITAGAELANGARTDQDNALLVGSVAWTVVHTASALSGNRWAETCRDAQDEWDKDDGEERREVLRHRAQMEERLEEPQSEPVRRAAATRTAPAAATKPAPRGFYCASSSAASVGVCAREKDACVRASAVLAAAVSDLARCTLVETAYCFDAGSGDADDACAPTLEACTAQRERAIAAGNDAGDCVDIN